MEVEEFIITKYSYGWAVKSPYWGEDKDGEPKIQYKETYCPNLKQCLGKVRDSMSKDCQNVTELISLLKSAEDIDLRVLAANGLR